MGCLCSKPQADGFSPARADVRARYSLDALRNDAGGTQGVHTSQQPADALLNGPFGTVGSRSSGAGIALSRSQWKQMRALARSNTNPHYYQLQQLQLLPSHGLFQQQQHQQPPAAFDAMLAGLQQQHHHHHHHHHHRQHRRQHSAGYVTLGPAEGLVDSVRQHASDVSATGNHQDSASNLGRPQAAAARDALSPEQVLALCGAVVQDYGPALVDAGIQPLLLASVSLIESGGCPQTRQYREHVGEVALGLCQVLLSTARWLASSQGFDKYGSSPTAADLEDPKCSLYFCAAYLAVLSQHHGIRRSEDFMIKAYHAGPKGVHREAAGLYWQKYLKAKHCLREVARAMAVTVATAAATAGQPGVQTMCRAAEVSTSQVTATSHPYDGAIHIGVGDRKGLHRAKDSATAMCDAAAVSDNIAGSKRSSTPRTSCEGTAIGSPDTDHVQVLVWSNAAVLIQHLSGAWEGSADIGAADAAESDLSSNSGSFIAQLLPSFWQSGSSSRLQQQQQQQQPSGNTSNTPAAVRSTSRRRQQINGVPDAGSSSSTSRGSISLVPVSCAALAAALLRLSCIDQDSTCIALANATAAAKLHSNWINQSAREAAPASTAGRSSSWQQWLRSSSTGSTSGSTARSVAASVPPYTMHIVGQGETVTQIAIVCNLALSDIMAVNPELPDAAAVQPSDCIALPVPIVPPRIYITQPGDTLPSIAKAHRVSMGRLLARNPELADPTKLQPGWVVALPGLKGDSKCGVSLQALVANAAAEAAAAEQATTAWPRFSRDTSHEDVVAVAGGNELRQRHHVDCTADATPDFTRKDVHREDVDYLGSDVADGRSCQDQDQLGASTAAADSHADAQHDRGECFAVDSDEWHSWQPAGKVAGSIAGRDKLVPGTTVGTGLFMFATGHTSG